MDTVDTIDTVNEKNQYEDEGNLDDVREAIDSDVILTYLHAILELRDNRALGNESEQLAAPCEGQWDDQSEEDGHLRHQEEEDLYMTGKHMTSMFEWVVTLEQSLADERGIRCRAGGNSGASQCLPYNLRGRGMETYQTVVERHSGYVEVARGAVYSTRGRVFAGDNEAGGGSCGGCNSLSWEEMDR